MASWAIDVVFGPVTRHHFWPRTSFHARSAQHGGNALPGGDHRSASLMCTMETSWHTATRAPPVGPGLGSACARTRRCWSHRHVGPVGRSLLLPTRLTLRTLAVGIFAGWAPIFPHHGRCPRSIYLLFPLSFTSRSPQAKAERLWRAKIEGGRVGVRCGCCGSSSSRNAQ